MYTNKCTKCGAEFETKNPKRVICPGCLYPDRKDISLQSYSNTLKKPEETPDDQKADNRDKKSKPGYHVMGESQDRRPSYSNQSGGFRRPGPSDRGGRPGGYNRQGGSGGYRQDNRPGGSGGYRQDNRSGASGGYRQDNRQGGPPRRPNNTNQSGGFRRPGPPDRGGRPGGYSRPGPNANRRRPPAANKKLLISREQVNEIENLYKQMLPLPNPDCHEVIGEKIELEPNKVFFGINLVRQKLKLPKLPYPKRKLAVSPDQLMAIKNLYEPLLPLPPIGCHKIIAKQLKIDEWRVHVGIGIIRKQMNLPRWNTEREDAPEEFKNQAENSSSKKESSKKE